MKLCAWKKEKLKEKHSCLSNHCKHYIMFINSTKSVFAVEGSCNTPEDPSEWVRLGEDAIA